MPEGIVFKAMSGFYYVEYSGGKAECRARGRFRLDNTTPLVGDRVEFAPTEPGKGYILTILPRKNSFVRPPVANIEIMVIVASAAIPVTDTFLIDKMTVIAQRNGCKSVICINKCDLDPAGRLYDIYSAAGFTTVRTSAETGEGVPVLQDAIRGSISAFTGNSGVGKSSILNALDREFRISVGEVSKKLGRGRHTTRHVELYKLSCGAIIADTPGFSAFDTEWLADKDDIQRLFPDFTRYLGKCRFQDCAHIKEPGCIILDAVNAGNLQKTRHNSYIRLYEQALEHNAWERSSERNEPGAQLRKRN